MGRPLPPVALLALLALGGVLSSASSHRGGSPVTGSIDEASSFNTAPRAGSPFAALETASATLFLAPGLTARDARPLVEAVDEDVAYVERAFGQRFEARPVIYLFASSQTLADGLHDLFAYPRQASARFAGVYEAVFAPDAGVIALNVEKAVRRQPFTLLRHELSHAMLHQVVGAAARARVPAWLDEGLARLAERSVAGAAMLAARGRSRATALAQRGGLPSLAELAAPESWSSRPAADIQGYYDVAAAAVELLEREVGPGAALAVLARVRAGASVEEAYRELSGRAFADFDAAFVELARGLAVPGIVVERLEDGQLHWMAHGLGTASPIEIRIAGEGYALSYLARSDEAGTYAGVFGSTWSPGDYRLLVLGPNGTVEAPLHTR